MKKETNTNNEITYLNIIKIIACFMVIVNHISYYLLEYKGLFNTTFYCIFFSISKVGVALFLFITGALIIDKEYDYKKVLKRILRVFIPMFILSFIIYSKENGIHVLNFFSNFLKDPIRFNYWYIYLLIGLYLVVPFLQKMVKKFEKKDYLFFLILFLFIPSFITTIGVYTNFSISKYFSDSIFSVAVSLVILGNYLSKINLSRKKFIISVLIFFVSFSIQFLSMYIPYLHDGEISYQLDFWDSLSVIFMGGSVFYILRCILENIKYKTTTNEVISIISKTTFGIYLIHESAVKYVYSSVLFNFCPLIGQIVLYFGVFILSSFAVYIFKKSGSYILKRLGLIN